MPSLDVPPSQLGSAPRPRFTSMSGPSPYVPQATIDPRQSFVPPIPSFTPGPQRARIWDKGATQRPRTSHGSTPSSYQRQSLYGDYFSSQPKQPVASPPLPQKPQALLKPLTNPLPPVPPKPPALAVSPASRIPLYPDSIPLPMASPSSQSLEPIASETTPSPDEREIELALTLSASEARKRERELIAQEEEELARALEESRLTSSRIYTVDEQAPSSPTSPRSPSIDRASTSAIRASAHPPEGESWLHMITPTVSTSSRYSSLKDDFSSSQSSASHHDSEDPSDPPRGTPNDVQNLRLSRDTLPPMPSLYTNTVSNLVRKPLPTPSPTRSTVTSTSPSVPSATSNAYLQSDYTLSSDRVSTSPSLSLTQSRRSSSSEQSPMPPFVSRPSWASVSSENSMSNGLSLGHSNELLPVSPGYRSPTHPSTSPSLSPVPLDPLGEGVEDESEEPGPSTRPLVPLSANHYVEREMLMGVCMCRV